MDKAALELDVQSGGDSSTPASVARPDEGAGPVYGEGSVGLRAWEEALSQALARLQASGGLSSTAESTTLGSAFAALLYGGLLLGQASGDASTLRAAMGMALSQVEGLDQG